MRIKKSKADEYDRLIAACNASALKRINHNKQGQRGPRLMTRGVLMSLAETLDLGANRGTAYALAGLNTRVFYAWIEFYPEFREFIERHEQKAVRRNVALIMQAAGRDWKAGAWWLERRHPKEWRPSQTLQIENIDQKIEDEIFKLTNSTDDAGDATEGLESMAGPGESAFIETLEPSKRTAPPFSDEESEPEF